MKNIDYNKHISEGWKVIDFIKHMEIFFEGVNNRQGHRKRIKNEKDLKKWCKDNQPHYKKHIPEVYKYFLNKVNFN